MSEADTRSGPLQIPGLRAAEAVSCERDWLHWNTGDCNRWMRPTDTMLIAFAKLANASGDQVRAFATRYAPLRAFKISESARDCVDLADGFHWGFGEIQGGSGKEPLALWKGLAIHARAILRINSALKGRTRNPLPQVGESEDWRILDGSETPPPEDVRDAQFFLCNAVNWWLELGGLSLRLAPVEWSREKTDWRLTVNYRGLVGAIAYRLLLTVAGEDNLYACGGCKEPYIRTQRAPRPGEENFCPNCTDIARKRAVQRYRERLKQNAKKTTRPR